MDAVIEKNEIETKRQDNMDVTTILIDDAKVYPVVRTIEGAEKLSKLIKEVKDQWKLLDFDRKEMTKPLDVSKALIMDKYRGPLELLKKAEKDLKNIGLDWDNYQTEQARIAQEKVDKENIRLKKIESDKLERQAKAHEKKGRPAEAIDLRVQKEMVKASEGVKVEAPVKTKGMSATVTWHYRVIDFAKLPDSMKIADDTRLGQIARANHNDLPVAGVEFYSKKSMSSR